MDEARRVFAMRRLAYASSPLAACDGADALVVVTEWKEFRSPDFEAIKRAAKRRRWSSTGAICIDAGGRARRGPRIFRDRPALTSVTASRFSTYRERAAGARLLVVGDVMLDRYWFGDVERISPEAPVPVVKIARSEERPGGAANVARNAAALGAQATLLSVVGDDEPGATLERLLAARARERRASPRRPRSTTTVKLRVIGRQQQLLRIDFETPPSHEVLAAKLADYERLLVDADLVILSDYGKGGLAHIATMIERARAARQARAGRSEGRRLSRYRGATIITPNRGELREVIGRWRDEAEHDRQGAGAARRARPRGAARHAFGGGHELCSRRTTRSTSRRRRARCTTCPARATR